MSIPIDFPGMPEGEPIPINLQPDRLAALERTKGKNAFVPLLSGYDVFQVLGGLTWAERLAQDMGEAGNVAELQRLAARLRVAVNFEPAVVELLEQNRRHLKLPALRIIT